MTDDNTTTVPADATPIDPCDSRGAGAPGWPAIGDVKVIDGHSFRWDGRCWQRTDAVV
ncbi:hypothetical protein MKK69_30775 [Methylobacterium sp. J-026]|uniref:hypothetical protein n=1 Tax=Methylobacterium sp. J-026 TaxID=2836624 RepID=UPI001FB9DA5C|nr:hypothetical protein [Methylobacterium sp. J-026]MCJ2138389.1 hypothetical protein [Methylobacterium sp. J-026]